MKIISFIPFVFFIGITFVYGQSFEEGLELYERQNFQEAVDIFTQIDDEQSILFAGKSYFGLQNYVKANEYLRQVAETAETTMFRQEAVYTLALSHFRMKNLTRSLELLYDLAESGDRGRIRFDAQRLYRQIMRYLSLEQRFTVLKHTSQRQIAKDIVVSSFNYVEPLEYTSLVDGFLNRITEAEEYQRLKAELNRDGDASQRSSLAHPDGIVYNIGVILPADVNNSADLLIPRNLYYGITIAAEEFNSRNPDKKIYLKYRNSYRDPDSTALAFKDLVLNGHVDAVIGPLFSEPAERMSILAEEFRVPMIAPLANSDDININHNYTYQMNPTFGIHGKMMARHAVETLGLDTLAVMTQKNALGTASAHSFRREAERLGAFISYFIEEDYSALGYDLSEFTKVFTSDRSEIEEHNYIPTQGIYAPFTGQAANTLMNLLMTDLEVLRSRMIIMGSEEWENARLSNWQNRNFEIYYTHTFEERADSSTVAYFYQDFETRFGSEPDRFAKIGFDVGTFLFNSVDEAVNPVYLGRVLMNSEPYKGLQLSIDMDQSRINQHLFIQPLSQPARERVSVSR